jgi:hypothetical protein
LREEKMAPKKKKEKKTAEEAPVEDKSASLNLIISTEILIFFSL